MSLAKTVLHRFGILGLLSQARSGTWKYLRGGYSPRRFWEGWGSGFPDQKYQREIHAGQEWLLAKLAGSEAGYSLEVGCGFGRNLEYLLRQRAAGGAKPQGRLFGVDISGKMLKRGRAFLDRGCGLACADILKLPFPDGRFDTVFTHGVLMHVPPADLPKALSEIRRVAASTVLLVEETYWKGMEKSGVVAVNGYTFLHDYLPALQAAGFAVLESSETGGSVNLAFFHCRAR
jgi:SAM-dependent methyltransferase